MWMDWVRRNRGALRFSAVVLPFAISGVLFLLHGVIAAPAAALILVLLVVGAAATGDRTSGILAGLSGAVGFDFFLTQPYLDLHIANGEDIELAVLLLLVGLAVNELALWGGRQRAAASEQAGFISGVLEVSDLVARGVPGTEAVDTVAGHIRHSLAAERVDYRTGPPSPEDAVIQRDGSVTLQGISLDVPRDGLPTDRLTAVPVIQGERTIGHFGVTTATRLVRPSREQLRVAVLLADQIARRRAAPDRVPN
jgi:K+-sensing histidine kinase KdpD